MSITTYRKKRNFKKTPEPTAPAGKRKKTTGNIFVVHRHEARNLHYDFRLEVDGVLKSWAVPKGPSMNPAEKRLAIMVEDHPIGYAQFHGTIPEGNYGAGEVEIWDNGTFEVLDMTDTPAAQLRKGTLKFRLSGKKLKGAFALVMLKRGNGDQWLLLKLEDEHARHENGHDKDTVKNTPAKKTKTVKVAATGEKKAHFIKPMLAKLTDRAFKSEDWIFEVKWDGYRAIAELKGTSVQLYSRNGLSFAERYTSIIRELKKMKLKAVLDGEIVVLDEHGRPSFQKLQLYEKTHSQVIYYVFDLLEYNGTDLKAQPLIERKELLRRILPENDLVRYCDHYDEDGIAFFKSIREKNLEGMIAKEKRSHYLPGKRTDTWLKVKNHAIEEAVIAGYTAPRKSRQYFGALILGIYNKEGRLEYAGHTGTGFTAASLKYLHEKLKPLVRSHSPFDKAIKVNSPVTWVEPVLVANIKYSEITNDKIFRHPVFLGLRPDKGPEEVTGEIISASSHKIKKEKTVTVNGHKVTLTNQDKLYWPEEGITKGDVIDYYNKVYKYIIRYLKDRPESLRRNPNGINDEGFFQKDAGDAIPAWVKTIKLTAESANKKVDYIICNDKATLFYLNNLGCIELNPWNSRKGKLDYPDYMVLDIDPAEETNFKKVVDVALAMKEVLDKAGAHSFCKTSGSRGLHIYVPLGAMYNYDQTRAFAELVARLVQEQLKDTTTVERSLNQRKGKIYLDYLQNKKGQTLAAPYSLRPRAGATVSTPLHWDEVTHKLDVHDYTIHTIHQRLDKWGDIFSGVLRRKTDLKKCIRNLEK